jgi:uncharacterized protein (TIGR00369 family)
MNQRQQIEAIFQRANFVNDIGITLQDSGPGWCESTLALTEKHLQQNGFAHAGVCATIADHTAGGAAISMAADGFGVLSIEFKINLLRPAVGQSMRCRATVLRAGKTVSVVEAEVFCSNNKQEKLVAKATVTLAMVSNQ